VRPPIMAISDATSNAELIVQCRDLGYLPERTSD
jgi:hypothetical protein